MAVVLLDFIDKIFGSSSSIPPSPVSEGAISVVSTSVSPSVVRPLRISLSLGSGLSLTFSDSMNNTSRVSVISVGGGNGGVGVSHGVAVGVVGRGGIVVRVVEAVSVVVGIKELRVGVGLGGRSSLLLFFGIPLPEITISVSRISVVSTPSAVVSAIVSAPSTVVSGMAVIGIPGISGGISLGFGLGLGKDHSGQKQKCQLKKRMKSPIKKFKIFSTFK